MAKTGAAGRINRYKHSVRLTDKGTKMSITLEVPEDLAKELAVEASRQGLPLSEYALRVLATRQATGETRPSSSTWPREFFEDIRIDDPAFSRPDQGTMPPLPSLTSNG